MSSAALAGAATGMIPCLAFGAPSRTARLVFREEEPVARACDLCGKGLMRGNKVSHAHNISRRVWNPNLQNVRAIVDGRTKQMKVCTRCIKANKVQKRTRKAKVA